MSILGMSLKTTNSRLQPHFPGSYQLTKLNFSNFIFIFLQKEKKMFSFEEQVSKFCISLYSNDLFSVVPSWTQRTLGFIDVKYHARPHHIIWQLIGAVWPVFVYIFVYMYIYCNNVIDVLWITQINISYDCKAYVLHMFFLPDSLRNHSTTHSNQHAWKIVNTINMFRPDQRVDILQIIFQNAFCWMKIVVFWFKFHLRLFLRILLTISHYWFR